MGTDKNKVKHAKGISLFRQGYCDHEYLREGGVYHNLIGNQGSIHEERG
jgi:hypothetical protein